MSRTLPPRRRSLSAALLTLVAAVGIFAASMVVTLYQVRRYEELSRVEVTDTTWLIAELRHEALRFQRSFDLFVFPQSEVDKDAVVRRYEIMLSRLPLMLEGPEAERVAGPVDGAQATLQRAHAGLLQIESELLALEKGDFTGYERLKQKFEPLVGDINDLSIRMLIQQENAIGEHNANLRQSYDILLIAFGGALITGGALILLLILEVRRSRRAERRTAEAELRLHEAIDSLVDGFAVYDRQGRLALWNNRFVDLSGALAPFIAAGRTCGEIREAAIAAGVAGVAERTGGAARRPVEEVKGEYEEQLNDGRWVLVRRQVTPSGRTVVIRAEITTLKSREAALDDSRRQAEEASRVKSTFLATMSHELRTPLNAIIGFSEMIHRQIVGPLPEAYRSYAADIHGSGHHLLSIIDDILDISRVESGQLTVSPAATEAGALLRRAARMMAERAKKRGVFVEVREDGALGLLVDQRLMLQALTNLVENAIKHSSPGGRIRLVAERANGGAMLSVADEGGGIAETDLPHITEPFYQGGDLWTRKQEGTGLGLALVKAIVEAHDGSLRIDSRVNEGTAVRLCLPPAAVSTRR